jgi:hypothetical protein
VVISPRGKSWLEAERPEYGRVIYKHWDAMAKLKLYDFSGYYRGINIDNVSNTPVLPFDGDFSVLDTTDFGWEFPVKYLVEQFGSCTFLSLGSGGGGDVLQALDFGAAEVHAVEVIPHINHMMIHGDTAGYLAFEEIWADSARVADSLAAEREKEAETDSTDTDALADSEDSASGSDSEEESPAEEEAQPAPPPPPPPVFRDSLGNIITCAAYSGHLYDDPRVKVVTEDARTYVKRYRGSFDIIFSWSSNSWAALGSGSFALAENYIFTKEAFIDYWYALTDSGYLCLEHQMYMPRLLTEALEAMQEVGVADPRAHVAVYTLPSRHRKILLMSRQPLTEEVRQNAFGLLTPERSGLIHLLYPAPDSLQGNLYATIVDAGWRAVGDTSAIDLSPCTDDRPFIAQLGLWRNFEWDKLKEVNLYADFTGFPLSKLVIVIILLVVLVLLVPLNMLPYFFRGPNLKAVPWLYFFAIGLAFMMVEVVLIQKYALTIGASVYSIATVLLTLLLASGVGSRFADKVGDSVPFLAIAIWLVLDAVLFGTISDSLVGLSTLGRSLVVALLIAPLGFFMGMPFPKATLRVGELVDWGFSVNGAASVFGATLIVLVAFSWGFTVALPIGGLVYLLAWGLMSARSAW